MKVLLSIVILFFSANVIAQLPDTTYYTGDTLVHIDEGDIKVKYEKGEPQPMYRMKLWLDIPLTAGLFVTNYIGLQIVNSKGRLTPDDIEALDHNKVPFFDKPAIKQDPEYFGTAHTISDIAMKGSFAAPFALLLDNRVRKDWWEVILLYLEAEALIGNVYSWGVANINRPRPLVYNPNVPLDEKIQYGTNNSFYSGHVASTATATFFIAKVLNDYYPEMETRRWMLFAGAFTIPAFVGIFRYKAGKHFPSDIVAGLPVGAAVGVLIPEFHRWNRKKKENNEPYGAIVPVTGSVNGLTFTYTF